MGNWSSALGRYVPTDVSGPGIAPTSPSLTTGIRTVTSNTNVLTTDYTLLVDTTAGSLIVNLPPASSVPGRIENIKKIDVSANTVTVNPPGSTIDGATSKVLSAQWQSIMVQSDGTAWYVI